MFEPREERSVERVAVVEDVPDLVGLLADALRHAMHDAVAALRLLLLRDDRRVTAAGDALLLAEALLAGARRVGVRRDGAIADHRHVFGVEHDEGCSETCNGENI